MTDEQTNAKPGREPRDPLGFLIIPIFGAILVAVLFLWMNQKKDETKQVYFPVSGKITLNNQLLPDNRKFQINFFPVDESDVPVASAQINKDGTYELLSGAKGIKGAMPGEYRVSVVMLERNNESWRIKDPDPKTIVLNPKDGGTVVPPNPDPPFDKSFCDSRKTPQRAIVGKTDNKIDIDLPLPSAKPKSKKKKANQAQKSKSDDGKKVDVKKNVKQKVDDKDGEQKTGDKKSGVEKSAEPKSSLNKPSQPPTKK